MPGPAMPPAPSMPAPVAVHSDRDVRLATYDFPGSERDALFVHANGFCAGVFAPLIAALDGWHRVAYDARAHGLSTGRSADLAWERHRDDVLAVLDATGLDRPIGIGHSMGGAALLLAEQLRPGTFTALWLYEPIVFPPRFSASGGNPLAEGALRRRDRFEGEREAYANYAAKPPLSELSAECLSAYVRYGFAHLPDGTVTLRCRPRDEAAGYRMGSRHDAWDALGALGCPVVVARGADDRTGPAALAPQLAERLPLGELEEHPELGHFGPLAAPRRLAGGVRALAQRG